MTSPYENLPSSAFWRTGVTECAPGALNEIYRRKWPLPPGSQIATAGSCFAQHISRYLRANGYSVIDAEPAPESMTVGDRERYSYGLYSARYGNIYTVQQLLQLVQEVAGQCQPAEPVWEGNGRFFDALRPSVEPDGFATRDEVIAARKSHLASVKEMFRSMDVFVFTLGLTEGWIHKKSKSVYPTAPETIAGRFDEMEFAFKNFNYTEIRDSFRLFEQVVQTIRGGKEFKVLLTVSPVPLTATASGKHVLQASVYSKSVLRAVAEELSQTSPNIDYFPSYEIITNPASRGIFFDENLRTVRNEGVEAVMRVFFSAHFGRDARHIAATASIPVPRHPNQSASQLESEEVQCEEALLEAFATKRPVASSKHKQLVLFIGNSHLGSVKSRVERSPSDVHAEYDFAFLPVQWMADRRWRRFEENNFLTSVQVKDEYRDLVSYFPTQEEIEDRETILCLVGLNVLGDGIVRAHAGGKMPRSPGASFMPIVERVQKGENTRDAERVELMRRLEQQYSEYYRPTHHIVRRLSGSGKFRRVLWIASPNMAEEAARVRLGDTYVESGSQVIHNQIARSCFNDVVLNGGHRGWLITHPEELESASGFTLNKYRSGRSANNIHVSPDYFESAVDIFFRTIGASCTGGLHC